MDIAPTGRRSRKITGDASLAFRGFFDHAFTLFAHVLATDGATAPPQRFSYVGGSYTIPTMALLSQGGGQLLWLESIVRDPGSTRSRCRISAHRRWPCVT